MQARTSLPTAMPGGILCPMPIARARTKPGKPPDAASLRDAALAHLARFATTESGLAQLLTRRIERWARTAEADPTRVAADVTAARAVIAPLIRQLVESGAVSDSAFAQARARALVRAGRSRRAVAAHLAGKGVPADIAAGAAPDNDAAELAAALIHARKRRLGPWRKSPATPETLRRELGSFARAGFTQDIARRAGAYGQDEAEAAIAAFRAAL
jgi:regulatory protein